MEHERVISRIGIIEEKLSNMRNWLPDSIDEYLNNKKTQAAIEREIQIIIQSMIDICIQLVVILNKGPPSSEIGAIENLEDTLKNIEIIKELKQFRNILVHVYGKINQELVYNHSKQMLKDVPQIIDEFRRIIKEN